MVLSPTYFPPLNLIVIIFIHVGVINNMLSTAQFNCTNFLLVGVFTNMLSTSQFNCKNNLNERIFSMLVLSPTCFLPFHLTATIILIFLHIGVITNMLSTAQFNCNNDLDEPIYYFFLHLVPTIKT